MYQTGIWKYAQMSVQPYIGVLFMQQHITYVSIILEPTMSQVSFNLQDVKSIWYRDVIG